MPNWVRNNIEIRGDKKDCLAISSIFRSEESFDQIIPMPKILRGSEPSFEVDAAFDYIKGDKKGIDYYNQLPDEEKAAFKELAQNVLIAYQECGHASCHSWRRENWGTKWDAFCNTVSLEETGELLKISFDTAWRAPIPIYKALLERFPEISIYIEYADEEIGYNCGILRGSGGVLEEGCLGEEPPEEFAARLWGIDLEEL